ncbi:hypothetical protein BDY19DRAFT_907744 [Irpex rosettiformis]|uniref:Uncharacterized protein n=1 Tax=Irpex rosettiformis TaxID=378272 RepID=A0ACB8TYX4_9APHY|nr:hypothetical protein BDY19DRAFT_907744 [Irpex rosettiformis]
MSRRPKRTGMDGALICTVVTSRTNEGANYMTAEGVAAIAGPNAAPGDVNIPPPPASPPPPAPRQHAPAAYLQVGQAQGPQQAQQSHLPTPQVQFLPNPPYDLYAFPATAQHDGPRVIPGHGYPAIAPYGPPAVRQYGHEFMYQQDAIPAFPGPQGPPQLPGGHGVYTPSIPVLYPEVPVHPTGNYPSHYMPGPVYPLYMPSSNPMALPQYYPPPQVYPGTQPNGVPHVSHGVGLPYTKHPEGPPPANEHAVLHEAMGPMASGSGTHQDPSAAAEAQGAQGQAYEVPLPTPASSGEGNTPLLSPPAEESSVAPVVNEDAVTTAGPSTPNDDAQPPTTQSPAAQVEFEAPADLRAITTQVPTPLASVGSPAAGPSTPESDATVGRCVSGPRPEYEDNNEHVGHTRARPVEDDDSEDKEAVQPRKRIRFATREDMERLLVESREDETRGAEVQQVLTPPASQASNENLGDMNPVAQELAQGNNGYESEDDEKSVFSIADETSDGSDEESSEEEEEQTSESPFIAHRRPASPVRRPPPSPLRFRSSSPIRSPSTPGRFSTPTGRFSSTHGRFLTSPYRPRLPILSPFSRTNNDDRNNNIDSGDSPDVVDDFLPSIGNLGVNHTDDFLETQFDLDDPLGDSSSAPHAMMLFGSSPVGALSNDNNSTPRRGRLFDDSERTPKHSWGTPNPLGPFARLNNTPRSTLGRPTSLNARARLGEQVGGIAGPPNMFQFYGDLEERDDVHWGDFSDDEEFTRGSPGPSNQKEEEEEEEEGEEEEEEEEERQMDTKPKKKSRRRAPRLTMPKKSKKGRK